MKLVISSILDIKEERLVHTNLSLELGWWFNPYTKAIPYSTHVISIKGPETGPKAGEGDCKSLKEHIDKCTNPD